MEVAPPSSFSQVSALFNDTTEHQRQQQLLGIFPVETPNVHFHSSDFQQAASHTGLDVEFRTADNKEGHRLLNGPLLYPFQNKAQIFNHKFDPFYYDGSELDPNFNVEENLIGTPLGASTLEDPRMSYVKNMLQMKELHGANHPLDDSYLKQLFMVNAEKGSNYYQTQLDKLDAAMSNYSRMGRYSKHKPLHDIQFSQNIATGNPVHEKHTARIEYQSPSDAGPIQHSRRAKRMARIDDMTAPYHIVPVNGSQRNSRRGSRSTTSQSDLISTTSYDDSSIGLPEGPSHHADEYQSHRQDYDDDNHDRGLVMSSLGNPSTNVTPSAEFDRRAVEQFQTPPGTESSALQPLSTGSKAILEGEMFQNEFLYGFDVIRAGGSPTTPSFAALPNQATEEKMESPSPQKNEFSWRNELTTPLKTPRKPLTMRIQPKASSPQVEPTPLGLKEYRQMEVYNTMNEIDKKWLSPDKLARENDSLSTRIDRYQRPPTIDRSTQNMMRAAPAPDISPPNPANLRRQIFAEGFSPESSQIASALQTADNIDLRTYITGRDVVFRDKAGDTILRAGTSKVMQVARTISERGDNLFQRMVGRSTL